MGITKLKPDTIYIVYENDVYMRVFGEPSIIQELSNHFTFEVPGARFMPKFKAGFWNGLIYLYNTRTNQLYTGLLPYIKEFGFQHEYEVVLSGFPEHKKDEDNLILLKKLIETLDIRKNGEKITAHDYQIEAVLHAIETGRCILLSPTSSGKSLIIYLLYHWFKTYGKLDTRLLSLRGR